MCWQEHQESLWFHVMVWPGDFSDCALISLFHSHQNLEQSSLHILNPVAADANCWSQRESQRGDKFDVRPHTHKQELSLWSWSGVRSSPSPETWVSFWSFQRLRSSLYLHSSYQTGKHLCSSSRLLCSIFPSLGELSWRILWAKPRKFATRFSSNHLSSCLCIWRPIPIPSPFWFPFELIDAHPQFWQFCKTKQSFFLFGWYSTFQQDLSRSIFQSLLCKLNEFFRVEKGPMQSHVWSETLPCSFILLCRFNSGGNLEMGFTKKWAFGVPKWNRPCAQEVHSLSIAHALGGMHVQHPLKPVHNRMRLGTGAQVLRNND